MNFCNMNQIWKKKKKKKNLGSSIYLQPLFWIFVIGANRWFSKLWSLLWYGVFLKIKTIKRRVRNQDLYIKLWLPIKPRCLWFATTISSLWNMLLNYRKVRQSTGGLGQGVIPLQSCERVCERVADNMVVRTRDQWAPLHGTWWYLSRARVLVLKLVNFKSKVLQEGSNIEDHKEKDDPVVFSLLSARLEESNLLLLHLIITNIGKASRLWRFGW